MDRKEFLKILGLLPFAGGAMKLNALDKFTSSFDSTDNMPILFLGHGNPMNAITQNEFANTWTNLGKTLTKPKAILCVSAHWETNGTYVTAMEKPKTIHDFGGFPKELFEVQYPAPGSPELAKEVKDVVKSREIHQDHHWGLDHGCWSVVKHIYPNADVPVIQMSLDYNMSPQKHYELAKELAVLRRRGVLIIGSGNIVHNLRMINWQDYKIFDWAIEANDKIKNLISNNEHKQLMDYTSLGKSVQLAVPTPDHYLPLLYILGLKNEKENISFLNDKIEMGSIAMTSVMIK